MYVGSPTVGDISISLFFSGRFRFGAKGIFCATDFCFWRRHPVTVHGGFRLFAGHARHQPAQSRKTTSQATLCLDPLAD